MFISGRPVAWLNSCSLCSTEDAPFFQQSWKVGAPMEAELGGPLELH